MRTLFYKFSHKNLFYHCIIVLTRQLTCVLTQLEPNNLIQNDIETTPNLSPDSILNTDIFKLISYLIMANSIENQQE